MHCGHGIHLECMENLLDKNIYACPLCKKSMFDMAEYESYFDQEYAMYQMPEEYKNTKVIVICNDCLTKSVVPFHVFGSMLSLIF